MAEHADLRRLRWSVPRADESTNRWLDLQYDISRSLQLLIRESIQRDGYIDVVNRPVEQLPRRGRPPAGDAAEQSRTSQVGSEPEADERAERKKSMAQTSTVSADASVPAVQAEPGLDRDGAVEPVVVAEFDEVGEVIAPSPEPEAEAADQKSVPSGLDAFLTH